MGLEAPSLEGVHWRQDRGENGREPGELKGKPCNRSGITNQNHLATNTTTTTTILYTYNGYNWFTQKILKELISQHKCAHPQNFHLLSLFYNKPETLQFK